MLKLITYPDNILDTALPDFDFDNPIIDPLALEEEMVKIMIESNGIGLAANQVGVNARVFTMQTQNLKEVFTPFALFNPKVITVSPDSELGEEGCLSFPNMFLMVKRPEHVIVEFLDRNNNKHIIRLDGIDARCFLHELDHLNGVCFTEHVSKLKLQMAIKKQRKLNGRTKR
jgi:peptide deformylase